MVSVKDVVGKWKETILPFPFNQFPYLYFFVHYFNF